MIDRIFRLRERLMEGRPKVGQTPAEVVFRENKWRLLRYTRRASGVAHQTPVLLVPSLINRHYVLDLMPQKSFVEYLVAEGFDVYCIDWGTPEDEDRYVSFDDIADRYIGRALRVTCRLSGSEQAHVLGYCLGGTLALIHAAVRPERVRSLALLAAPVGFWDSGLLSIWSRTKTLDVKALVGGLGNVPWQLMQSAFQMLRPTMTASKATTMIDRAWDDEFMDGFLALETWGNDNVSFPGACYERYIEELYRDDALIRGAFSLSAEPVRLENVKLPVLAVTFEHDAIVPWQSAAVVIDRISSVDKARLHLTGGHVGAVVSKKARHGLWPALTTFWSDREKPPAQANGLARAPAITAAEPIAGGARRKKRSKRDGQPPARE